MELVDKNASVDRAMEALHWCLTMGHVDVLQALLKTHFSQSKLSESAEQCASVLTTAVRSGAGDTLLHLLPYVDAEYLRRKQYQANRNEITRLLCEVVQKGNANVVKVLLGKDCDVNTFFYGKPLLHLALDLGHVTIAQMLLENGADLLLKDQRGNCVLTAAICSNTENKNEVIDWLITKGADPSGRGPSGKQPIHIAAAHTASAIIPLAEAGCDVNAIDLAHGDTPLHIACTHLCERAVFSLVYYGAKLNKRNDLGETPLSKLLKLVQNPHNTHSKSRLKLARLLVKIGFTIKGQPENVCGVRVTRRNGRDKIGDVYRSLQKTCKGVPTLLHLCRLEVRENMSGVHFCKNLETLNLPHSLKSYLTFIEDFCDT